MTRQQWIQLVIVLIFFGFSALKVVFGKLQQQAAKRKIEMELERQRLEALRTGKPVEEVARVDRVRRVGPTPEQLQELARRRAAQLEELRRVQAAQRQAGQRVPERGGRDVIVSIPGSSGPTVPGTRPPTQRPSKGEERRQRPGRAPRTGDEGRQTRREQKSQPQPAPVQTSSLPKPVVSREVRGMPVASSGGAVAVATLGKLSGNELRRAIIAAEVLGRPVCERT